MAESSQTTAFAEQCGTLRVGGAPVLAFVRSRHVELDRPDARSRWRGELSPWRLLSNTGRRCSISPTYVTSTSDTRVPQLPFPSVVWLDLGGTYSVASQIASPVGDTVAQE